MQLPIAYNKFVNLMGCLFLCACTGGQSVIQKINIPPLPSNWEYVPCPHNLEKFSDCDFDIPLPKGDTFDAENYDYNYFWNAGYSKVPSVHFAKVIIPNDKFKVASLEGVTCEKGSSICPDLDYELDRNNYSIARFHKNNTYLFQFKTPKMIILVTDPSIGTTYGPEITAKNISLLETSLLNIRVK